MPTGKPSSGSDRERRAIAAVACPVCLAPQGSPCVNRDGSPRSQYGRPMVCADRRRAWQMIRDGLIKEHD